ncbi:hypothetical protein B0H17DRAFT_1004884 [Mycena rosella]|uniref:DUF6924 domain-containing protein n=1 Tax=Mycena rosella TaxID=1033263 RepID=A0AAD7GM08_MYCRO|nr:hypothetical protein B0H17DRAFT_1004884 [Mycena rosella]
MSNWAVFLTSERPSSKALNRAFVLIQDFEYSEYPADSRWILLTSKKLPADEFETPTLPLSEISSNDFAGMSLAEINTFVRAHSNALSEGPDLSASNWLVIDQKGLETSTCLVCEQYYNSGEEEDGDEEEEEGMTDKFRACRIPYEEAHAMMANLDIANMGFEEFVDEEAGEQEDGSWKWVSFNPETEETEKGPTEAEVKREKVLKELRDGGHAD